MSALETFLLFFFALLGTVIIFLNPAPKVSKSIEGKTTKQVGETLKETAGTDANIGCIILLLPLAMLYAAVIEPYYIIVGIKNGMGNPLYAYIALLAITLWWVDFIRAFRPKANTSTNTPKQPTRVVATSVSDGEQPVKVVAGAISDEDVIQVPVGYSDSPMRRVKAVIYALPTIYMWYLLLIEVNILS